MTSENQLTNGTNETSSMISSTTLPAEEISPTLHIIGLGLGRADDITVRGLKLVKSASVVYLENYTSILGDSHEKLGQLFERSFIVADREYVEERCDEILSNTYKPGGVAFLVVGDPFSATTHSDIWLRAREKQIHINVVHNASIMNAVGCTGLQLYRFGQAISLCFWTETDRPKSYMQKLLANRQMGLHTLCLLDIKVKEPSLESLARGKKVYLPPRFMSIKQAITQLLDIAHELNCTDQISEHDQVVAVARLGLPTQKILTGTMKQLIDVDFGPPLHSLIVPAPDLHFHEQEVLDCFKIDR